MASVDDRDIITRIGARDESGESDLFGKYHRQLIALARSVGLSLPDAEEAAGIVLYRAIERARAGKLGPNVGPWLRTSTHNEAIDRLREEETRRKREADVIEALYEDGAKYQTADPAGKTVVGGMVLVLKRALWRLRKREAERTGATQAVSDVDYLLWIGSRATTAQLAEWSGTTEGNARVRKKRVLERLREEVHKILAKLPEKQCQRLLKRIRLDEVEIEKLLVELVQHR